MGGDGDTIFAPATARGRAALAVIRLSGSACPSILAALTGCPPTAPRRLVRRNLLDADGVVLDEALAVFFAAGASFTGENSVEFQIHGGIAVTNAVMRRLSQLGARLAEPGEFARRAFENGRMALTQAEGLADLIEAETEAQRVQAMRLMRGALARKAQGWRESCIGARALIEAAIDFADEDLPDELMSQAHGRMAALCAELTVELQAAHGAQRLRDGFEVAILGRPNAGKSTLINTIMRREVAITSPLAGTTRDAIEARCDLQGLPVSFVDTAGLRDATDQIEAAGVEIAQRRGREADLRIILLADADDVAAVEASEHDLVVINRGDLRPGTGGGISALTGEGVAGLLDEIAARLRNITSEPAAAVNARHQAAIANTIAALEAAMSAPEPAIAAEELRGATDALALLIGNVDVEMVLDDIFGRFCLGK